MPSPPGLMIYKTGLPSPPRRAGLTLSSHKVGLESQVIAGNRRELGAPAGALAVVGECASRTAKESRISAQKRREPEVPGYLSILQQMPEDDNCGPPA